MSRYTQPLSRRAAVRQRLKRSRTWIRQSSWAWLAKQADALQTLSIIAAALSVVWGVVTFVSEAPQREKQAADAQKAAHYAAWQMINSSQGLEIQGGRLQALQDLNKDRVNLSYIDVNHVFLPNIDLHGGYLWWANFEGAYLADANFDGAYMRYANLQGAYLLGASFEGADLNQTTFEGNTFSRLDFRHASLVDTNFRRSAILTHSLEGADLAGADLRENSFQSEDLDNLRTTRNWQEAIYDEAVRVELGLPAATPAPTPTPWGAK